MKKKTIQNVAIVVILAAVLVLLSELGIVSTSKLLILQYIGIYSIMVLGINIVNGYTGIFSLAHAGFMAVGAYAAALCTRYVFTAPYLFPLALLAGGLAAMCVGLLVAVPSFKSKGDYLAIITLGFTLMVQSIFQNAEIVDGLVMVYIGGTGSITGSITGAAIWQIIVQVLKELGTWRWVVGGVLLCLVMIFLPQGIFGYKEIGDVWKRLKARKGNKGRKEA